MKYFLDRNLSEQLDLDLYLRHSPVQEFRNLVSRPAETMSQRIAQVREINRSGNMNGHSTSVDRQTVQVERGTLTPEQPSAEARPTAAKTTPEPAMSLYDLFGFTQEERSQVRKRKTRRKRRTPDNCPSSIYRRWSNIPPCRPSRPNRLPKRKSGRSRNVRNGNAAGRRKRPHVRSA